MKKSLKILSLFLALGMAFSVVGCAGGDASGSGNSGGSSAGSSGGSGNSGGSSGGSGGGSVTPQYGDFNYEDELLSEQTDVTNGYNSNLFYVNTLDFEVADPTVIYITEGDQAGYFYAYGTSDEIGCHGFQAWRSKDFAHWECTGVAYQPDYENTWSALNYWAPEIIYDNGIYWLFYNAMNEKKNDKLYLSVAYSRNPQGPFVAYEGRNADGKTLSVGEPAFDFTINNPTLASLATNDSTLVRDQALDASPFIDPATGKKYMYFSYYNNYSEGSFIYGVEMKDWVTPDYTTLTMLAYPGYRTVTAGKNKTSSQKVAEGNVNEGPFMVYHEGKYYLTMSVFGYTDENYHVIQAVGNSPLGDFTKIDENYDGGKVVSTDVTSWGHIVSAGHHCFIRCGEETFIAYHTFKDRATIAGGRALAVDKIVWIDNPDGIPVMHTNGPTWSVQPLPASVSGYKNIAPSATLTASNTADFSDDSLLTDGIIKYQEFDLAEEYTANAGKSTFTLTWNDYKTVRALMVYNSWDYFNTFVDIDEVEMEYLKADGSTAKAVIKDLAFDWDWHFDSGYEMMLPGGAAIAEFAEMPVKSIKLTVNTPAGAEYLAIGEIVVLGKDTACEGVAVEGFLPYTYENQPCGSPHIEKDSLTFGDVEGSNLETMWGYDLTHDDGTADAYIEQTGSHDQYAYFKDVFATSFYAEAEFSVTTSKPFAGDEFPKFGIAMTASGGVNNTIFYYVDAADNYTKKTVGCAQRKLDNSDWDWDATEQLVDVPTIDYTNGSYVKLAVLRMGNEFYMLCNDKLVIYYDSFNVFSDTRKAGVGFLSFNTGMKIKNYSATADTATVEQKAVQFAHAINGENMGTSGSMKATSGWDYTNDRGATPSATNTLRGEQFTYFKGINSTSFTAELEITMTEDFGDPYPKFGMVVQSATTKLFFYVDGSAGYTAQNVGYHWVANDAWNWGVSPYNQEVSMAAHGGISYTNGDTVKLKVVRNGGTFQLYANDVLVFTVTGVTGLGASDLSAVGAFSFTTGVCISNYSASTNA